MSLFDDYKKRLGMSNRSNTEATLQSSIDDFERNFSSSPSFYQVDIDGELIDTIINKTNRNNEKLIHFRHDYEARIGSVITFKDKRYLLLEKDRDEIFSFGKMIECNNTMSIQKEEEKKILVGYDEFGAPVYKYEKAYEEEPCVVRDTYYSASENAQLPLPEGKLEILLQYQVMLNIKINEEFEMYDKTYKITDVGYVEVIDNVGYVKIHAERRDDRQ